MPRAPGCAAWGLWGRKGGACGITRCWRFALITIASSKRTPHAGVRGPPPQRQGAAGPGRWQRPRGRLLGRRRRHMHIIYPASCSDPLSSSDLTPRLPVLISRYSFTAHAACCPLTGTVPFAPGPLTSAHPSSACALQPQQPAAASAAACRPAACTHQLHPSHRRRRPPAGLPPRCRGPAPHAGVKHRAGITFRSKLVSAGLPISSAASTAPAPALLFPGPRRPGP